MNLKIFIEYGALISGIVGVMAYIPQIIHLLKNKDSSGNSLWAWHLWIVCSLLPLVYAVYINDLVFTVIYSFTLVFLLITTVLIHKYKK
jgi:uncharacterized protein with PQ loop repeat